MITTIATVLGLSFLQTIAFSMVSRARNRDSDAYHVAASCLSNGIWFACIGYLSVHNFGIELIVPYIAGTVAGSLSGSRISMRIETAIGAKT